MCQAFEGEQRWMISSEIREIKDKYKKHKDGEITLSQREIDDLFARYITLTM